MALDAPWIRLSKDIFDHPLFDKGAPLSEREAWIWLLMRATHKRKQTTCKGTEYNLQPGELIGSRAFLAKEWGWTAQKVRCFLALMQTHGKLKLRTISARKPTIISICKYSEYQKPGLKTDPDKTQTALFERPQYNNNKTKPYKEVGTNPKIDSEKEQAKAKQAAALNPDEAEAQASVAWTQDGRIEVRNGFRAELLEKLNGDPIALRDALDQASEYVGQHKHGFTLMKAVRSQLGKQSGWRRQSQQERQAAAPKPRSNNPSPELLETYEKARQKDALILAARLQRGREREREPA